MIKAILWDIDGTLTDFKKAEIIGIKNGFKKFNLGECTDEMLQDYSEINDRYWKMLERKEITKPLLLTNRFDEFFEKYNLKCDTTEFNRVYQEELRQAAELNPGAKETVISIKELNIPQYVVTNGLTESQNIKLENVKLRSYFENVFISDEIGHDKPTVEFFEPVLKEVNEKVPGIKKEEIIIIGDSLSSDIQGGINVGIKTCWYNKEHLKTDKTIDYEIDKLESVLEIIKELNMNELETQEEVAQVKEVEEVLKAKKVSLKDIVDKNYRTIIVCLSAISLLFICLFIGTSNLGGKTYTIDEIFKCESGSSLSLKLPSNWYLTDDTSVFTLDDDHLEATMYGYLQETSAEEIETSFELVKQEYETEEAICGSYKTLLIKDVYGGEADTPVYDFAYIVLNDHQVLCVGFIDVAQNTEMKILNSIK